ncbi:MAG: hypothetical protein H6733_14145 [Alphaproteobacteria bacterium]|nr:hypothetical protein [Alphaproteobacteria bacterium]
MRTVFPLLVAAACGASTPPTPAPATSTTPPSAAAPSSAPSAHAILDGMDDRTPVPMPPHMALHQKAMMRDHLEAVQQVLDALAVSDWARVEAAASRIGTSPEMAQTCEHMGAAAPGFTEQSLDFHARADAIAQAARDHDAAAVLRSTSDTLSACTACHARWRQQVESAADYGERMGGAAPQHGAVP